MDSFFCFKKKIIMKIMLKLFFDSDIIKEKYFLKNTSYNNISFILFHVGFVWAPGLGGAGF